MGYAREVTLPASEPVSVAEAKTFMKLLSSFTDEDSMIGGLITTARENAEGLTGRCLAQRKFTMVLDYLPYAGAVEYYGPEFFSLAHYSQALWNHSQEIKVLFPPLKSVESIRYVKPDGTTGTLAQDTDFVLDRVREPARIFPIPGQPWPPSLYVANAVEINYTAGYDSNPAAAPDTHTVLANPPDQQPDSIVEIQIPQRARTLILMLTANLYFNREPVAAGSVSLLPMHTDQLINSLMVVDFAPTRG